MNNLGRKFEIFVVVAIIALIGIIYAFKQKPVLAPTTNNQPVAQNDDSSASNQTSINPAAGGSQGSVDLQVPTNVITYQGKDGQNALVLLEASHRVDVKHYSFGDMVNAIDGIAPDSKHFWAMYVNGQFSQVGASAYVTKSSDTIKWELDAVVDTTK